MSEITFGVMTDLHTDLIHDGKKRLSAFVSDCQNRGADFMIQLGDFIKPLGNGSYICPEDNVSASMKTILAGCGISDDEKRSLLHIMNDSKIPAYHVLGNHDLDLHSKEEMTSFLEMPAPYYSFDRNGFHFIVLDLNYGIVKGESFSFDRGNYLPWCFTPREPFPVLPQKQLDWLRADLDATKLPVIIFSHEGLCPGFLNAKNTEEISAILSQYHDRILLCMYGHKHQDLCESFCGIPFYCVNSISGYSLPPAYAAARFDEQTESAFPNVKYMAPYIEPLYVIVTIDDHRIRIEGRSTQFLPPTPKDLGVSFSDPSVVLTPTATSVTLPRGLDFGFDLGLGLGLDLGLGL